MGYSGQKNPYGANYQGGADQNYGVATQHSYGNSDYSGYGSQGSNGYSAGNTQWPNPTYGQQQYGYSNANDGWQSAQSQQSAWSQPANEKNVNSFGESNARYGNLRVEKMLAIDGINEYSNLMQSNGYDNSGYGYGTNEGPDYQQGYGMSSYSNTGQKNYGATDQSHYSNEPISFQNSNYGNPTYITVPVADIERQFGYGNSDYSNQYGRSSNDGYGGYAGTKYSTYGTSQDYDKFAPQSQYISSYVPTVPTQTANYGTGNYDQTDSYNPYMSTDYTGAQNTNNAYRSDNSNGFGYSSYVKPQVDFTMNIGYGSQKNARNVDITPKLTNNLPPVVITDDGYKAKNV